MVKKIAIGFGCLRFGKKLKLNSGNTCRILIIRYFETFVCFPGTVSIHKIM